MAYLDIVWEWHDGKQWIVADENKSIEEEYQHHLAGTKDGLRVFHCFGDGRTAFINFSKMETECGSGKCRHGRIDSLPRSHMVFKLRRTTK